VRAYSYQREPVVIGHPSEALAVGLSILLREWGSKPRRMGAQGAAAWFCKRLPSFHPLRLERSADGQEWSHVVVTDGDVLVDLVPHWDQPAARGTLPPSA
jgi:hypothetical protein